MKKKITSRKFLMAVVMIIVMLIVSTDKNTASACATLIAIAYMVSEAIVDNARAIKRTMADDIKVVKDMSSTEEQENENK